MYLSIIFLIGLFIMCILALILLWILDLKNENTCKNCMIILHAICEYNLDCIERGCDELMEYDVAKDYDTIMWRLFDWGYENILPKEAMEKIRPFIKE